jgi:carboxyl-terminal processing protease
MIYERHFDTTFNGVNWLGLREELRPRAAAARTTEELRDVIREMLRRLGQSHFALIPGEASGGLDAGSDDDAEEPSAGPGTVGIELRIVGGEFVVSRLDPGGAAERAGVLPGWVVQAIGDCRLTELLASVPRQAGDRKADFRATMLAMGRLDGEATTSVRVTFRDGRDAVVVRRLARLPEPGEEVRFGNLPPFHARFEHELIRSEAGAQVGLIRFNTWMPLVLPRFDRAMDSLRRAEGIVIDLRGNPGGVGAMVIGTSGHFLTERVSLGTLRTRERDLRYVSNPRLVGASGRRVQPFAGPVAILVDGMTGSTSEVFAGGLQAIGRARVFGETTAGAVLPALNEKLPNGDVLYHAFADFITPRGDRLEGRGVLPDAPVPLDRAHLLAGQDAALAAAIRWIETRPTPGLGQEN